MNTPPPDKQIPSDPASVIICLNDRLAGLEALIAKAKTGTGLTILLRERDEVRARLAELRAPTSREAVASIFR